VRVLVLTFSFVLLLGCTEVDGPPLSNDESASRICPGGALKRPAIQQHVVEAFRECCDGTAHWIPEHLVPAEFRGMLERDANTKSLCVPDKVAVDPVFTPRKCTSLFGQPGACISVCVRDVAKAPLPLPRDICGPNERCAPCIDPRSNQETGSCRLGFLSCEPSEKGPCKDYPPALNINSYPECCNEGPAHCAPSDLVPEQQKKDLSSCNSGSDPGFCVPDKFLLRGGHYTPKKCKSVGGREGRCLSMCVKSVQKDVASLPRDICEKDERCAPCYDPRTGFGTGACTIGHCDEGPREPPKKFESCGPTAKPDAALCVPGDAIPIEDRCNFDDKGCKAAPCKSAGELCVPRKIIDAGTTFQPKVCHNDLTGFLALFKKLFKEPLKAFQAMSDYREGRCLSRCLPDVREKADLLGRGGVCDEDEVCVPCFDPEKAGEGKIPTGACDRKPCPVPPNP
jgi:hypothetical protein